MRATDPTYKQYDAEYFQRNKAKIQPRRTKRHRERYNNDPIYRLKDILRSRLLKAIKKGSKTGSAIDDLGCSIEEFKKHIESLWKSGMNWDNAGKGKSKWNLDHIKPLAFFDLTNPAQLKEACRYINLQPIWEKDHYRKTQQEFYGSL